MLDVLNDDWETKSDVPIDHGLDQYFSRAEGLLYSYSFNRGAVKTIDLTEGEQIPREVLEAWQSPDVVKWAFNRQFENYCARTFYGIDIPPEQTRCTMILAWEYGFSGGLGDVAARLGLPLDRQKMGVGRSLIRKFCCPRKPTKFDKREWITPKDDPEAWRQFVQYNNQDVVTEMSAGDKLLTVVGDLPPAEWAAWAMDQRINARGIGVDMELVHNAIAIDSEIKQRLTEQAIKLTGLINPNSRNKLIEWLASDAELETDDLRKKTVAGLLKGDLESAEARELLEIRQQMAKSSTAKYAALARSAGKDARVRNIHQFYGAVRTGRFAGRIFQGQNLPRVEIKALEDHGNLAKAREWVKTGDVAAIEAAHGKMSVPSVLATLIRSALVPKPGHGFIVCDFSAIEARMLAWLADEEWRLEVFRTHGKIYEASASEMFKIPMAEFDAAEKTGHKHPARAKGKAAELGLGYAGGANALVNVGALDMGLTKEELPPLVKAWREANKKIVMFWRRIEADARECIETKRSIKREFYGFQLKSGVLFMVLPNGRRLAYPRARIESVFAKALDKYKDVITFDGVDRFTKQWSRIATFGGSLTENLCQAACRDLLIESLKDLESMNLPVVMHVHDEAVIEVPIGSITVEEVETIMGRVPTWAPGFPHAAAGFSTPFYCKE